MQVGDNNTSVPATPTIHCKAEGPKLPSYQLSTSDLSLQPHMSSVTRPPRKPSGTAQCISELDA
eukprot:6391679-Prorocentrum_lima.AAC.1